MVRKTLLLFLLAAIPILYAPAQTTTTKSTEFDTSEFPQWVRDLRRWEIVAFGSIPFTMFTTTFAMDMYRWSKANGMDFSDEGRRYAPWPLKSPAAVPMESSEMEKVLMIAAGLSITVALTDMVIVQIKRYRARKKAEALPVGTTIITRTPLAEETPETQDSDEIDETVPEQP
ncbi:MAG: hypothetical protein LBI06_07550 [Treponema sp.]|jgi:hypothetical protein|nr:hypothetical protein [Treponema sp.]